jgi:hypothetical protein
MPFILLLLILVLLAPTPMLPVVLVLLVFLLPFLLIFQSFLNVILIPWQMVQLAADKRMRQNHALEHATVNVIEERYGPTTLTGLAAKNGFFIMGPVGDPGALVTAARIAQERMKRGERQLAIHPRCGTSIAAANFIFALVFLLGQGLTGHFTLWGVVLALLLAHVLARPVGALMQRAFTTDPDVSDLEVVDVADASPQMGLNLFFPLGPQRYFVQTRARQPVHWLLRWF